MIVCSNRLSKHVCQTMTEASASNTNKISPSSEDLTLQLIRHARDDRFLNRQPVPSSHFDHRYPTFSHCLPPPNAQSPHPYERIPLVFRVELQLSTMLVLNVLPTSSKKSGRLTLIPSNNNTRLRLKEPINILQSPVRRLRIEQVGNRDETEADTSPDDPEFPTKIRDSGRRHLNDHVVHYPVCGHCERGALCTHLEGVNFGGI